MTTSPASTRSSISSQGNGAPGHPESSPPTQLMSSLSPPDDSSNLSQLMNDPVRLIDERIKVG